MSTRLKNSRMRGNILPVLLAGFLTACSSPPGAGRSDPLDPYENPNRSVFAANMALDTYVLEPVADSYRKSVPVSTRRAIDRHLDWTGLPATTVNSALQGRLENAGLAIVHFAINGLTLGFVDLTEDPQEVKAQDFGQTLAFMDVPQGSYLMVPVLGPNTSRGLAGRIVDTVTNPMAYLNAGDNVAIAGSLQGPMQAVSFRANWFDAINDVKYGSLDPYARTRSVYFQSRAGRINAKTGELTDNDTVDSLLESFLKSPE